ncbi:flagellar hook assembly protein FlgD [Saccharospirillum salsuginis]|uniref:Basal-body rod modification protein FlgD n=1 Tax=Saccharospirillum salsuginis TaxID=418750 RepID=A0A918K672_9GAMM|nr:flagellar hook assembly protein FlgD [Saccharospirillum salsuginis]GGX50525.1 basal-body rod modification protein FlgD [Saccharospirillum salsuginis]
MSDVNNVSGSSALSQYDINKNASQEKKSNELGKNEFLELMIAQLNNQNPLEPQKNAEFVAQMAQFSTVEGIQNMSSGFESLASSFKSSQALQASSLVGGAVTVDGQDTSLLRHGELVYGMADVPSGADSLKLQITNEAGEVVENVPLGYQPNGPMSFKWDGANLEINGEMADIDYDKFPTDDDGNIIPHDPGEYQFQVVGNVGGQQQNLNVHMSARVDSVTLGENNDLVLNLAGGGTATMADVKQINHVY